ncbi:MAG: phosphoserine phosphatase SerB [Betaproteobacteria bacterium]|jgi:phosphoserine phosphatase|nr:phosphoserine phosphatase SerB [Betaproteobacteria bacterium]MDH4294356.1 phosphoserine phosphatase SerB [Betaproteobacteria bacterium]MDH5342046.1 phosphoserine phosphatase SerB [Betaproteobacteria bacterium]
MHLVIQGAEIETRDLKEIAKLSGAGAIERLSDTAFRLKDARPAAGIDKLCANAKLDHGFVPEGRKLTDCRLLVMDMDSTLITMETIDELADMVNLKAEVARITARAMRGEIEYDQSLRERLALLEGLDESALQRVYDERLKFSPGAEQLLEQVRRAGIKTLLVSGGFTYMTDRLKTRIKLDYTHSNVLEVKNGKLTGAVIGEIVNADAKRAMLLKVAAELNISREQIAGVGDGANDLKFLAECGVSVAYRAKPVVREHTTYALNHSGLDAMRWLLSAENT